MSNTTPEEVRGIGAEPVGFVHPSTLSLLESGTNCAMFKPGHETEGSIALYTHPAPSQTEPVGWKLVPIEPTPEMINAMVTAWRYSVETDQSGECRAEYRAMLAAAPRPPAGQQDRGEEAIYAECYMCGKPMDGTSEDDCHCFHRRELAATASEATAAQQDGWISVDDRLPLESDSTVAVLMDDGSVLTAWATYWHGASNKFARWTFPIDPDGADVTHWTPLPAAPANGEGAG